MWVSPAWFRAAWDVFVKDVHVELRTRYAVGAVGLFAVTTVVAVSSALNAFSVKSDTKAALLWLILLFAAMSGLARVFVREEEAGTADTLRLNAPGTAVYAGKWLFNVVLVLSVEAISVPLFLIVLPPPTVHVGLLIGTLALGGLGLASASTFVAALIAQASSGKSALFFITAFPVMLPVLLASVKATLGAFDALPASQAIDNLGVLGAYAIVMSTAALMLFEYVWNE